MTTQDFSPNKNNDMSFFQQLAALGNVDLSIRIKQKNETLTLSITPGNSSNITPVIVTGTPAELDAEFLNSIAPQVQSISGIVTNIKDVKAEAAKLEEENKKPKEKPAPAAAKKAEIKKVDKPKVSEPALFSNDGDDDDDTQNEEE